MKVNVNLSDPQLRKLAKGHQVQLKHSQLSGGAIGLNLHPLNYKKVAAAHKKGKGCRLQLSPEEIEGSGILDWLKKAGKFIKDKIIDTDLYQSSVKPIVRDAVNSLVSAAPIDQKKKELLKKAVDLAGDKTGAFGYASKRAYGGCCPTCGMSGGSFRL